MQSNSGAKSLIMNNIFVLLVVGIVIGGVVGYLYAKVQVLEGGSKVTDTTNQGVDGQVDTQPKEVKIAKPDPSKDHWLGKKDAKVVMVEYSDFECPFCGNFFPTAKQVEEEYSDSVAIVYRHFPLSFHPKAKPAAEATECVADLVGPEAFWTMHDAIFEAMPNLEVDGLADLAVEAGANEAEFQECMDEGKFSEKVDNHLSEGSSAGVAATPTSVIYNMETGESEVIEGALPYDAVKQALDKMLES